MGSIPSRSQKGRYWRMMHALDDGVIPNVGREIALLHALLRRADRYPIVDIDSSPIRVSLSWLERACGASRGTILRYRVRLARRGLIRVDGSSHIGKPANYWIESVVCDLDQCRNDTGAGGDQSRNGTPTSAETVRDQYQNEPLSPSPSTPPEEEETRATTVPTDDESEEEMQRPAPPGSPTRTPASSRPDVMRPIVEHQRTLNKGFVYEAARNGPFHDALDAYFDSGGDLRSVLTMMTEAYNTTLDKGRDPPLYLTYYVGHVKRATHALKRPARAHGNGGDTAPRTLPEPPDGEVPTTEELTDAIDALEAH